MRASLCFYLILPLLFLMTIFSSCKEEENVYTPDFVSYQSIKLFEIPYATFGASKSSVKEVYKTKIIKEESETKIIYKGNSENEFQVYYFEDGKLVESAIFIKAEYEDYVYINAMKSTYKYWGDTRGPVSTFYGFSNSVFSYIAMTKQSETIWMIDYIAHDRVTYDETFSGGVGVKTLNLPKVINAKEYLPY